MQLLKVAAVPLKKNQSYNMYIRMESVWSYGEFASTAAFMAMHKYI